MISRDLVEHISRSLVQQQLVARLATFFGLLARLLAAVGRTASCPIRCRGAPMSSASAWRRRSTRQCSVAGAARALTLVLGGVIIGLPGYFATRMAATLLSG